MKNVSLPSRYSTARRFSAGWSSVIYISRKQLTNGTTRPVIIKRLRRIIRGQNSKLNRSHLVAAMVREASALKKCRHAGIPRFVEWLDLFGDPCIVMERLPGRTLDEIIESDGTLTWTWAQHVAIRLLEILECVHRAGWIHCDLNPANILLSDEDVYLLDFGAAQKIGEPPEWDWPLGRHRYMPPEHLQGRTETPRYSRLNYSSDVHQIACLLVYLLTLQEAFRLPLEKEEYVTDYLRNLGKWMARPVSDKIRRLSVESHRRDVPNGVDRIISRALEPDPHARYASAAAMKLEILSL
jgi:serine/threonine protein kinase